MIAQLERTSRSQNQSFFFRKFSVPYFDAPFHYHPQMELTYIQKGKGRRYVGDQVASFQEGDLVLIGSNLPHCWICDHKARQAGDNAVSYVIQFSDNFLTSQGFLPAAELHSMVPLFSEAGNGLLVGPKNHDEIVALITQMPFHNPIKRLALLLEIFSLLLESDTRQILDSSNRYRGISQTNRERLQKIYGYIISNYQEKVELSKAADLVNLSPNAFCRFFKRLTGKTLVEATNEYRLSHAVSLLKTTDLSISGISYESGFQTVPYFNAVFRKAYRVNPTEFRNNHCFSFDKEKVAWADTG